MDDLISRSILLDKLNQALYEQKQTQKLETSILKRMLYSISITDMEAVIEMIEHFPSADCAALFVKLAAETQRAVEG